MEFLVKTKIIFIQNKGKAFKEKHYRTAHFRIHQLDSSQFKCGICKKGFLNKKCLEIHSVVHSDAKDFVCKFPECGKAYNNKSNMVRHERTVHEEMRKVCKIEGCDRDFTNNSALRYHMNVVHGLGKENDKICGIKGCKNVYPDKGSLKLHQASAHRVEKLIPCPIIECNREFPASQEVIAHVKSIHGLKWKYNRENKSWGTEN